MEAIKENIQDIVPNPTSLRELSLKYKDRLLTNINVDYFILALGVTLSAITSVMFYNYITLKRKNSIKDKTSKEAIESKEDGTKEVAKDEAKDGAKDKAEDEAEDEAREKEKGIEKTDKWKKEEWFKWLKQLEEDWKIFFSKIEHEKNIWLKEKEEDWKQWLILLDNKWMHYNPNMEKEFNTNVLQKSANWTEFHWKKWMLTEGILYIDLEWKKWIYEKHAQLDQQIVKQWIKWKKDKIVSWLTTDWKRDEQEHWDEFENKKWTKWFCLSEMKNLDEFKERINKEWEDWFSWVKVKDNIFINFILNDWLDWKDDNYAMFSEWMELFVKKWINEKQWTVWEQEKGNAQIQKESPCSLVNNEQSS
ncbi:tryptophan-rich antigen [Plasmodium brasilianum]|uniref:Tryptophan-rich antigen n=1 Tax=Plasmodium brasilianum TaxID=5824 RepID=A0ACB9YFM8_PLABR|nr:tryptophan-rich antigen [Plasmodium brasilianum]